MGEVKLKPCPFCGGEAATVFNSGGWIYCKDCDGQTGYYRTPEEAIEAWNGRVNNDNEKSN